MATTCAQSIVHRVWLEDLSDVPDPFWNILEQYRHDLESQALQIVGNAADAEDVVQETFSEAIRSAQKLTQARSIEAWLRAVNKANAMDLLRSRKSTAAREDAKAREPEKAFTTGGISAVELHDSVARAIESLPPHMRSIVVMHYWQHQSCEQIAGSLGMPVGTVKWHLAQAAIRLHGKLKLLLPDSAEPKQAPQKEEPQ